MVDRLPRICFLAPNAYPLLSKEVDVRFAGGAELQQVIVARGLAKRGYPVVMICLDFGQEEVCEIDGVTVYRAFKPTEGIPLLRFLWPRLARIWACLKRADAEIYYHRAGSMLTGVLAAFCQLHSRKSIFAVAGVPQIRFFRDRWLFEYGLRNVTRVVVQSAAQGKYVREKTGRDSVLIPNVYQARDPSPSASRSYILWVGMIRQVKRPDLFLDLAESLPNLQFRMIGGRSVGESALYESVQRRASNLDNVDFPGFVPYREIDPHFDRATLFVNTSDSEGFPNTFLQAWTRGISTISFVDVGARINGEVVGVVVESLDGMIVAIEKLLGDPSGRREVERASRDYVEFEHSPRRIFALYEALFSDLLNDSDPGQVRRQDEDGGGAA